MSNFTTVFTCTYYIKISGMYNPAVCYYGSLCYISIVFLILVGIYISGVTPTLATLAVPGGARPRGRTFDKACIAEV